MNLKIQYALNLKEKVRKKANKKVEKNNRQQHSDIS